MMRKAVAGVMLGAVLLSGCKKQVPDDIVKKTISSAMRMHAAGLVSIMCGGSAKGLSNPTVTIVKRGTESTGTAHIKGSPTFYQGKATQCEGDVEYSYTYSSKTIGAGSRRRTMTTWYLQHMKLVAIQTPGVTFKTYEEDPEGEPDDE